MEEVWRRCGGGVEEMWRRCGGSVAKRGSSTSHGCTTVTCTHLCMHVDVEMVWRRCGGGVEEVWRRCGDGVEMVWRWCGDGVEMVWRWRGGGVAEPEGEASHGSDAEHLDMVRLPAPRGTKIKGVPPILKGRSGETGGGGRQKCLEKGDAHH